MSNLDSEDTLAQLSAPSVYEDSNDMIGRRLPFGSLDRHQLRKVLCLPVELGSPDFGHRQRECRSTPKGNYMASATLVDLRITNAKLSARRPRSLEAVLELPHELVFEIFECLHPIDLYHMMCATKSLRGFLLDRRSAFVWEKVFLRHPSVPECPEDVSFPKWASLLFGPATCDKCSYPNVLVDFAFRKRLCQICMRSKCKSKDNLSLLVFEILFDYPEAQNDLWELVPYSFRSSSFFYYEMTPHFLEEDVRERAHEMKAFLMAIKAKDPNAEEEYQNFKIKTAAATLASTTKHARICNAWATQHFQTLDEGVKTLLGKFEDICYRRLLALGHDQRDVSNIQGLPEYLYAHCKRTSPSRFARKGYRCHLPSLEMMVLLAKNERLAVEYTQRVEARREDVAAFYHNTKIYIDPAHWQHLPKIKDVQQFVPFVDYIRNDPEPSGEQCIPTDAGRSAILGFVDKWIKEKRVHLRDILEKAQSAATPGLASQYKSMDVLDLATAVFLCRPRVSIYLDPNPCPALIGWDAVGPHLLCAENKVYVTHRHPAYENTFQFCRNGYHTVIQLLDLLKLDPLVTTAKDLDKLNARFICNSSGLTVCVFTWRECVDHVSRVRTLMSNPPALTFSVLTEEATQSVLHHETLYPPPGDPVWSCRRCTEYLEDPTTRKAVISHLKLIHGISAPPVENIDFFYLQPKMPPERKRFFISLEGGTSHRCARCKHPSNLRIWGNISVLQHLNDKHKISEPIEGVDFTVMTLIRTQPKH